MYKRQVHGAGRTMSRNEAAGKKKWIRDRDGVKKPVTVGRGKVNFEKVKTTIKQKGIELRGSGADEAPECYKNLDEVLAYMGNTINVLYRCIQLVLLWLAQIFLIHIKIKGF